MFNLWNGRYRCFARSLDLSPITRTCVRICNDSLRNVSSRAGSLSNAVYLVRLFSVSDHRAVDQTWTINLFCSCRSPMECLTVRRACLCRCTHDAIKKDDVVCEETENLVVGGRWSTVDASRRATSMCLQRRLQSACGPSQYEPADVADWSTTPAELWYQIITGWSTPTTAAAAMPLLPALW